jgi:radical SAM superfamily enzyme YgiQ (UPF0313 family)
MNKILMINTFYPKDPQTEKCSLFHPPLGLLAISAALARQGYDIIFIDPRLEDDYAEKIDKYLREPVLFVGMSAYMGSNLLVSQEIGVHLKRLAPQTPLVWGGPMATSSPEVCFANAPVDYIVLGMGEETVIRLAEKLNRHEDPADLPHVVGRGRHDGHQKSIYYFEGDLDQVEVPDLLAHWAAGIKRIDVIPIISSRGCPRNCAFCYNNTFSGRRQWYGRSGAHVLREMDHWAQAFGIRKFYFVDDNFLVNTSRACQILDAVQARNYAITQIIGHLDDYKPEVVARLGDGIDTVHFSIESASAKIQKLLNKPINLEKALKLFSIFTEKGIKNINTNFMFGLPTETEADIAANIAMAAKIRALNPRIRAVPYIYTPQPKDDIIPSFKEYYDKIDFTFKTLASIDLSPNRSRYLNRDPRPWMSEADIKFYLDFILAWFYHFDYKVREDQGIDIAAIYQGNPRVYNLWRDIPLPTGRVGPTN